MNTIEAFARGEAARVAGNKMKAFDWDKAAEIIKERQPEEAGAGLATDYEWTHGSIYKNGVIIPEDETYVYLSSVWATPMLTLNHFEEELPCWKWENEDKSFGYWPESARKILYDTLDKTITEEKV